MESIRIKCPGCGADIKNVANVMECPYCGAKLSMSGNQPIDCSVKIKFPINKTQLFNKKCFVYDAENGEVLVECEQGETAVLNIVKPTKIKVVMKGAFGKKVKTVNPGEKYMVRYNNWGKIYLSMEDYLGQTVEYDFSSSIIYRILNIFK